MSDLKSQLEKSIQHLVPKKEINLNEIKAMIEQAPFISLDLIKEKIKDRQKAEALYEEYKKVLPEFYVIVYKDVPIQCGWAEQLDREQQNYFSKIHNKSFMLSKNKIFFSLVNRTKMNEEVVDRQLMALSTKAETSLL